MDIKILNGVSTKVITDVFNLSFSDYFIPFKLTEQQMADKMEADKTDLNLSVGVFENDILIGFILHGKDSINGKNLLYNGGTGVIPSKRGHGLTKKMYSFILPILKENDIDSLILEVISNNVQAIKSYEQSGYKKVRTLACYKGDLKPLKINNSIEIKALNQYNWDIMELFWDITPTWQVSKKVLDKLLETHVSFGAFKENKLIGYCIYNSKNNRIQHLAVAKSYRKDKIASTLLSRISKIYGNTISIINIDKSSKPMLQFFENIGLEDYLEQLEMKLDL